MSTRKEPIGVFDSGVGGISTLREMRRQLPRETFIYYGDTLHAPYGTKTREEVVQCVRSVVELLLREKIKALVIACNTATSAAAAVLRAELDIPVIGMEPALKPAQEARKDGSILVMATPLTLREEKFGRLMERYGEGAVKVPCPGLMELVEKNDPDGARRYLERLFSGYDTGKMDAVVLGCTHYVFLREMIRDMLPPHVVITDGSEGTARQLARVLGQRDLLTDGEKGSVILRADGAGLRLGRGCRCASRRLSGFSSLILRETEAPYMKKTRGNRAGRPVSLLLIRQESGIIEKKQTSANIDRRA